MLIIYLVGEADVIQHESVFNDSRATIQYGGPTGLHPTGSKCIWIIILGHVLELETNLNANKLIHCFLCP